MKKSIFILLLCFVVISCQKKEEISSNKNDIILAQKCTLIETEKIYLYPDDDTPSTSGCIQFINDSLNYLISVNEYANGIYFFNLSDGYSFKKYIFEKEGVNGVGKIDGFLYLNDDSIYVYSSSLHTLSLVNSESEVINKYKLFDSQAVSSSFSPPSPNVMTVSPIMNYGNKIILSGHLVGEMPNETFENRPTTIILDTKNNSIQYVNGYPAIYHNNNWGGSSFRNVYQLFHDNKIITSFPASHDLQIYDIQKETYEYVYAGANVVKEIKPFRKEISQYIDDDKAFEWYAKTPSYEGIIYDSFRNVFYRIVRLPIKNEYDSTLRYNPKQVMIIVLDSQLNYLGETILSDKNKYSSYSVFVNELGLNMQIRDEDGERMAFITYKLEMNESK